MTLIEATKKAVTDHICNCDYSVECDSHPIHVNAFAEAIWRAAVSPKAAEAPGGREREENRLAGQVFTEVYGSRPEAGHPLLKAVRRALRDYRNYVLTVAAPAADEREKFKKWAVPKPWYTPAIFAYGEKEGEFADALVQEFWECWRAGLSSQEGK